MLGHLTPGIMTGGLDHGFQRITAETCAPVPRAGLALSLGCEGGLLFTVAHELLHAQRPLDRALSNLLLCSVGYMHWTNSHIAHHSNVEPPSLLSLLPSRSQSTSACSTPPQKPLGHPLCKAASCAYARQAAAHVCMNAWVAMDEQRHVSGKVWV